MKTPLVSVIIPVYNVKETLREALTSVLTQTYASLEIIIVDDGSTDNSLAVIENIDDPRIQIHHQENRGLAAARNAGIHQAQGEFIAFLDSDDLWQPEKIEKQVTQLLSHPEVGVSFTRSEFITAEGLPIGTYTNAKWTDITALDIALTNPPSNGSTVLIRRKTLDDIVLLGAGPQPQYFDEQLRHCEDIECWLRIALLTSWQFEGLPEPLTLYRMNANGLSANFRVQYDHLIQTLSLVTRYAPEFIDTHACCIKAHNAKTIARTALRYHRGDEAFHFLALAIYYDWRILYQKPFTMVGIATIAILVRCCPARFQSQIDTTVNKIHQWFQQSQVSPA